MSKKKNFVSLFSGCGGLDLGFHDEGFACKAAVDIDPLALAVNRKNLKSPVICSNLANDTTFCDGLNNVDVLLAGPPCQGFSTAGKREVHDPRNMLLLIAGQLALRLKPKVFIVENVSGVTAGAHRQYWDNLHKMLQDDGYQVKDIVCQANKMGLAQLRRRIIMFAWRTKKEFTYYQDSVANKTLHDVLQGAGLYPNHTAIMLKKGSDMERIANRIKPGQKLSNVRGGLNSVHTWNIPEVFGSISGSDKEILETLLVIRRRRRVRDTGDADPVPVEVLEAEMKRPLAKRLAVLMQKGYVRNVGGNFDLAHAFNGKFRRLEWDKPSFTVDTRFGNPRYFLHPEENRGFTVREAARIQGFPDSFIFHGPECLQYRMIGNAVPPPISRALAKLIKETGLV